MRKVYALIFLAFMAGGAVCSYCFIYKIETLRPKLSLSIQPGLLSSGAENQSFIFQISKAENRNQTIANDRKLRNSKMEFKKQKIENR